VPAVGTRGVNFSLCALQNSAGRKELIALKNPMEVLRMKEQEILKTKREIEALKIAVRLLGGEEPTNGNAPKQDIRQFVEMP
jgi:hypothetical protein